MLSVVISSLQTLVHMATLARRFFESTFLSEAYFVFRMLVFGVTMGIFRFHMASPPLLEVNQHVVGVILLPISIIGFYGMSQKVYWAKAFFASCFILYNCFFLFQYLITRAYGLMGLYFFAFDLLAAIWLMYRIEYDRRLNR